jgi:hypothetical protein
VTQQDNNTPSSLPWDGLDAEELACLGGMRKVDDPFRDFFRDSPLAKPQQPQLVLEPSPIQLAAFDELLDSFSRLPPSARAIAARMARERAEAADQREAEADERRTARKRQRKPSLARAIAVAKKAGATSVTVEGVTYRFGAADAAAAESNPFELEARRLRRQRGAV